jgi:hypothetical protein
MMASAVVLFQVSDQPDTKLVPVDGMESLPPPGAEEAAWGEHGPISRCLKSLVMSEDVHYGFLPPDFQLRTGYSPAAVGQFVSAHGAGHDVLLFSDHPHHVALFRNVFERGDFFAPGLLAWARRWTRSLGAKDDPGALVMAVDQMVISNCFVARPRFWRRWLELCASVRRLLQATAGTDMAEEPAPALHPHTRIELMRCVASYLLACEPAAWRVWSSDPFVHGRYPLAAMREDPTDLVAAAALKHAMHSSSWPHYALAYHELRRRVRGQDGRS